VQAIWLWCYPHRERLLPLPSYPWAPRRFPSKREVPSSGDGLRLEGGYDSRALLEIRTEGAHVLEADLREWTRSSLWSFKLELRRRGADAIVSESSVEGIR